MAKAKEQEEEGFEIAKYVLVENQFEDRGSVAESQEEIFQLCLSGDKKDIMCS